MRTVEKRPVEERSHIVASSEIELNASENTGDFLSHEGMNVIGRIVDAVQVPEPFEYAYGEVPHEPADPSYEQLREVVLREEVERLLDQSETAGRILAQAVNEMFQRNKARAVATRSYEGDDVIDICSFVTHDRSRQRIGEQYTSYSVTSPRDKYGTSTSYVVELFEHRNSQVRIEGAVLSEREEVSDKPLPKIRVFDDKGEGMAEVLDTERQREIYTAMLYELVVSADMQRRREESEQVAFDANARQMLFRKEPALFSPATSME